MTVPSPIEPLPLYPQVHKVPFVFRAATLDDVETLDHVVNAPTWTGLERFITVPSPIEPRPLYPQPHRVPSVLIADVFWYPLEIWDQFVKTPTWTGLERFVPVLLPSCP